MNTTKIYDKRDEFDSDIVNCAFLDVIQKRVIHFARARSHASNLSIDFSKIFKIELSIA